MGRAAIRRRWGVWALAFATSGCFLTPSEEDGDTDGPEASSTNASTSATTQGTGDDSIPGNGYCEDVADWPAGYREFEEEMLVIVNEERAAGASCGGQAFGAAPPLTMNGALRCAARVHSQDMATQGFFDHDNPSGESPFDRMGRAGYSYLSAGENIAAGQRTPEEVMAGWMDSPGHCSNIMNPDFSEFGGGYFVNDADSFGHYWTQTFGRQ